MEKEPIGPRSKFGKCLSKTVGRNWERLTSDQRKAEIKALHEDFLAQFGIEKARDPYYDTVMGILDYTILPSDLIHEYRKYAKSLVNSRTTKVSEEPLGKTDFSWMEDEETITFEGSKPSEGSELHQELEAYVKSVVQRWEYHKKPFWITRSRVNKAIIFVITNVGLDEKTKFRVNVNAAIGASVLPKIDDEYLFQENGSTVKYAIDITGGRTFWGWAFNLTPGLKFRYWMSKSLGFKPSGSDIWEQVAKAVIRLDPALPKGFQIMSGSLASS
jgi:hypothetical protein